MSNELLFSFLTLLSSYKLYWFKLGISFLIIISTLVFKGIFTRYLYNKILKFAKQTRNNFDEKLLTAFKKPLQTLILVLGMYLALKNISLVISDIFSIKDFDSFLIKILRSYIIIFFAWGLYCLEGTTSFVFKSLEKNLQIQIDKLLIPFISRIFRFLTVVLALFIIAEEWGYDVNGFIAGLGLGGLAFALAAKDAIANIFGGVIIIIDKPFSIGDWIKSSGVEGVVEDINFRSTKIRTFDQAIVTLPNSILANGSIINWSKMGKRRITFNLGVLYSTTSQAISSCISQIDAMLHNHPDIHKETIFVTFDKFNDSSLDIFLYFFTNTTKWDEFLKVKQDVNFKIMEILEGNNVTVAFPSRSIYFENSLLKE